MRIYPHVSGSTLNVYVSVNISFTVWDTSTLLRNPLISKVVGTPKILFSYPSITYIARHYTRCSDWPYKSLLLTHQAVIAQARRCRTFRNVWWYFGFRCLLSVSMELLAFLQCACFIQPSLITLTQEKDVSANADDGGGQDNSIDGVEQDVSLILRSSVLCVLWEGGLI